jgi:adsorption protein B
MIITLVLPSKNMGISKGKSYMEFIDYFGVYWLVIKYLIYFSAIVILLSGLDDFFIDVYYWVRRLWRGATVYRKHKAFNVQELYKNEENPIAIMVPAWQETGVVAEMAALAASTFEYYNYHIFIGTYPNDPDTQAEVDEVVNHYQNVHKVVTRDPGPTSKSDCLNNVIEQIFNFEKSHNIAFKAFVLHDAEDVIHPLELKLFNHLLIKGNDLIQVPVVPFERKWYQFTAGHYEDEFAEVHGKDMLVRESILGFVPSAGVGTALSRNAIETLREIHDGQVFILGTLTEDYNLGYTLFKEKMKLIFVRVPVEIEYTVKNIFGKMVTRKKKVLIAVREFFPSTFQTAVRQKSRWIIGIVFQGWKTIGWTRSLKMNYILFRDRKAVFTNFANLLAYFLVLNVLLMSIYAKVTADTWWFPPLVPVDSFLWTILFLNAFFLINRIIQRMYFTSLNFGARGALLSVPRIIWGNFINIAAMWRATKQVFGSSKKVKDLSWDKTTHDFPVNVTLRTRLGELCIEDGLLDMERLETLLEEQRETHKPLGMLLIEKEVITEHELTQLLSRQSELEYVEITDEQVDHEALKKADPYVLVENDLLILKPKDGIQPLVSSGHIVDVMLQKCEHTLGKKTALYIAQSSCIEGLQHTLLFDELSVIEFRQLKIILKQKMLPKSILPQILEYKHNTGDDLIASCQHFGFLPPDQLKRITK